MKKILLIICFIIPLASMAQVSIGLKGGLNFADVSNASSINNSNRTGFNAALFLEPGKARVLAYRTELMYSRQGYNFSTNTNTGSVNLDYITSAHFICINITHLFQIHFGGQIAYLVSAEADSTSKTTSQPGSSNILGYSVRADYGLGAGVEVRPVLGLLFGLRYNFSLSSYPAYTIPIHFPAGNHLPILRQMLITMWYSYIPDGNLAISLVKASSETLTVTGK